MAYILVVDDDPGTRSILRRVLEEDRHEVTEAEDGKVALRRFAGRPADLVIADMYMPDMDGIEMLMRLREAWPDAKVIAVSGGGYIGAKSILDPAKALGAVAAFTKPLDMEELLAAVREATNDA